MNHVVEIEKIGNRGMGIARFKGKVIFVPLTAPGDRVEVTVKRSHRDFDEAELVRFLEPSILRREPPCAFYCQCGGCHLQHLPYSFQVELKQTLFRETIGHHAGVGENCLKPIIYPSNDLGYRSRIETKVLWNGQEPSLGFMARGSNRVVPVDCCLLACLSIRKIFPALVAVLKPAGAAGVTTVDMAADDEGEKTSVTLHSKTPLSRTVRDALSSLAAETPNLRGLYVTRPQKLKPTPLWDQEKDLSGVTYTLKIAGVPNQTVLQVWPGVFRQVNPSVNSAMVSTALAWAVETSPRTVLDLYAGMGNFTIPLSHIAEQVAAVEGDRTAVKNGVANSERNSRKNILWRLGPVKGALRTFAREGESFDLVLLDPPRSGAAECLDAIVALGPERIIYVSCEPTTLARDLRYLQKNGTYRIARIQPLDMFPQTFHLESLTLLEKA